MYKNGKNIIIIDRSVNCVDAILRDARKTKPLSSEEEQQLWQQMQQGSQRARARLIESNMRYAVSVAKRYLPSGAALEDLILAGWEDVNGFEIIKFLVSKKANINAKTKDFAINNYKMTLL